MMQRALQFTIICMAMFFCQTPFASAQIMGIGGGSTFPKLPYSIPCTAQSMNGTWKLAGLYEVPQGPETEYFAKNPMQFYVFDANTLYGTYSGASRDLGAADVQKLAVDPGKVLQQYVVSKTGMVYFYKNSIATDNLACFIVAHDSPPFSTGQMLLMPPEKIAKGRMVKIYQRLWTEEETKDAIAKLQEASQ